jgi:hypothetical protein
MNRRLLTVVLLATLVLASVALAVPDKTKPEAPRVASYTEALALSAKTSKPVIVDFFAVW